MVAEVFGGIVNVTSLSVRMPLKDLDLSPAARMALTGYVAGVARQVAPHGVTGDNLLPGAFATERLRAMGQVTSDLVGRVPAGRAGDPEEFGETCAFLCSRQAAYMTAQNILIDGGVCAFTV